MSHCGVLLILRIHLGLPPYSSHKMYEAEAIRLSLDLIPCKNSTASHWPQHSIFKIKNKKINEQVWVGRYWHHPQSLFNHVNRPQLENRL